MDSRKKDTFGITRNLSSENIEEFKVFKRGWLDQCSNLA